MLSNPGASWERKGGNDRKETEFIRSKTSNLQMGRPLWAPHQGTLSIGSEVFVKRKTDAETVIKDSDSECVLFLNTVKLKARGQEVNNL